MASSTEPAAPGSAGRRWVFAATLLGLGAVAVLGLSSLALDWQPARFWREPWRAWSAALVHLSGLHLVANLAGCALVGALGFVARVPQRSVTAWLVAWPLTQIALLARPDLDHYAGLSGVLHAGVAVVAVHLIATARGLRQAVGLAVLGALALKVAGESPFAADALLPREGWDIAIAPFSHAAGLAAGAAASALAEGLARSHAYHRSR